MTLFDRIPQRLFSALASPGKILFSDVLFIIYRLFRQNRLISRDSVVDEICDYLSSRRFEDEVFSDLGQDLGEDDRAKAQAVLRRLHEDGWIDFEVASDYAENVILMHYAEPILETLDHIRAGTRAEYAHYVFGTYAALTSEDAERNRLLALNGAFEQTGRLMRQLHVLNQNIREFMEQLLSFGTPQETLDAIFNDYKEAILDRSYHQLRTSDHVSRYRPQILARIENWVKDSSWIDAAAQEDAAYRGVEIEEASDEIRQRLDYIQTSYQNIDSLLNDIDRRHSGYSRAAMERVRYQLTSSEDLAGKIKTILAALGEGGPPGHIDGLLPALSAMSNLYPVRSFASDSLYSPRARRREHESEPIAEQDADQQREELMAAEKARGRLERLVVPEKVRQWAVNKMGDNVEVTAEELEIEQISDYVNLVHLGAWGGNRRLGIAINYEGDQVTSANGRFSFRNVTLRRRR